MKKRKRRRKLRKSIKYSLIILLIASAFILINQRRGACKFEYDEMISLHSESALLFRMDSKQDCFKKNEKTSFYPASLTKLMSAFAVIDEIDDLDQTIMLKNDDLKLIYEQNASSAYLKVNESYSLKELLYASILESGADATSALERYFQERDEDLVSLMNDKALKLKMKDSTFQNVTGLHDEGNIVTSQDLKKLVLAIYDHKDGKDLITSLSYPLNDGSTLKHTLLKYGLESENVNVLGGKTGFIDEVGENLIVIFEYEDIPYGLILLKANGNPYNQEYYHIEDAIKVMEMFKK